MIRQAGIADAEKLLNCIKTYIPQSEYIPKLEQEIKLTIEQEKDWINSFLVNDNSLLLVAEYENQIIGNIEWAKENPILELVWLQVYTENRLGLSLYRKMGFEENGIIKNFFKYNDKYFDNLTMTMYVK